VGYARFEVESDVSRDDFREILIEPNFHVSAGGITQTFPGGRDTFKDLDGNYTGKLPTACFETSARFDPGMSGGPVMDENGSVCGIIATGFNAEDAVSYTDFASATPFVFLLGLQDGDRLMRVYEMAQLDLVSVDEHFDKLQVIERDGTLDLSFPIQRE
jgi:hypothetical protein